MAYVNTRKAVAMLGIHPNTLRKYAENGTIPTIRGPSGRRLYDVNAYLRLVESATTICYCRVSSHKQRDDRIRQVERIRAVHPDAEVVQDIGSGLNFKRKGLNSILERAMRGDKLRLVVSHRDRLARFGYDLIRLIVERTGGEIVVLDQGDGSPDNELSKDILAILHVFSYRMHGGRAAANRAARKAHQDLSECTAGESV